MTQLAEFLYPAPARRSVGGIMRWWESRRLPYNLMVGAAGLVTTVHVTLVNVVVFDGPAVIPLPFIFAFGLGANLCYTMGPALEIAAEKLFGGRLLPTGPALYRMGLTFSLGLALFPALLVTIMTVAFAVGRLLGLVP